MRLSKHLAEDCCIFPRRILGFDRWMFDPLIEDLKSWKIFILTILGIMVIVLATFVFICTHNPKNVLRDIRSNPI